jgi:hypothetical protein
LGLRDVWWGVQHRSTLKAILSRPKHAIKAAFPGRCSLNGISRATPVPGIFPPQTPLGGVSILKAQSLPRRSEMARTLLRVVLGLLVMAGLAVTGWVAVSDVEAQSQLSGTWTASVDKDKDNKIHLSLERNSKGHRNQMDRPLILLTFRD